MKRLVLIGALMSATAVGAAVAQTTTATIGRIQLPRAVMADGKVLAAGTYQVRLTDTLAQPAIGQSADAERWVEFVSGGRVVGREVATVISASEIGGHCERAAPPSQPVARGRAQGRQVHPRLDQSGRHQLPHQLAADVTHAGDGRRRSGGR